MNEGARKPETKADEVWFFGQRRERDEKKKKTDVECLRSLGKTRIRRGEQK